MLRYRGMIPGFAIALLAVAVLASVALAQQFGQWSDWMGTSATSVQYRWELTGSYEGMVQFRNTTNNAVTINYSIWVPGQNQRQTAPPTRRLTTLQAT